MGVNKCMCSVQARPSLSHTVMKRIRSTRGTNKWTSARWSHVELCRCFPVSLFHITAVSGRCAVSKEPPHLWWIKGETFSTFQLESDVLSPATPSYLQSAPLPNLQIGAIVWSFGRVDGVWGEGGDEDGSRWVNETLAVGINAALIQFDSVTHTRKTHLTIRAVLLFHKLTPSPHVHTHTSRHGVTTCFPPHCSATETSQIDCDTLADERKANKVLASGRRQRQTQQQG